MYNIKVEPYYMEFFMFLYLSYLIKNTIDN